MADVHSKEIRSYNMSRIRSKDTKPEMLVRKYLFSAGFRYKLHDKKLPGKPDIVLPKYKTVIFIHGCFWHGHENCNNFKLPKTRTEWWSDKINKNRVKDLTAAQLLKTENWEVINIWECDLKPKKISATLADLNKALTSVKAPKTASF
jgi:DNA mismatch endonuclease (patch repair protein)